MHSPIRYVSSSSAADDSLRFHIYHAGILTPFNPVRNSRGDLRGLYSIVLPSASIITYVFVPAHPSGT